MGLPQTYRSFSFLCILFASPILSLLWLWKIRWGIIGLSALLLVFSLENWYKKTKPLALIAFLTFLGGMRLIFYPIEDTPPPSEAVFRVHALQESSSQIRLTLILEENGQKFLAIYYKPRLHTKSPISGFFRGVGQITKIRQTKTQIKLNLRIPPRVIQIIFRKERLSLKQNYELQNGLEQILDFQMPSHHFLKYVSRPKGNLRLENISYIGFPEKFSFLLKKEPLKLDSRDFSDFPTHSLKIGDFVQPILNGTWKTVRPFQYPFYLFAQGFAFQGHLEWIKKSPLPSSPTFTEKVVHHLLNFYTLSPYQSFYRSVLLAKNPLDKNIYRLFQRNELVHLLVISGSHIEIIISFLLFLLSLLFAFLYGLRNPRTIPLYLKELRFFEIKTKSLPIFLSLTACLLLYLNITDAPQAGARAIFGFLFSGIFFHRGWKTSVFIPFVLSITFCLLLYPQWFTYPLGLFYSSLAVFSLYFCLPLIKDILAPIKNLILRAILFSILVSTFVSVFIAPISFYFFHYYNFLSIFTNIVMGILFAFFIYFASFASLLSFISFPVAQLFLRLSDGCTSLMLYFLGWSDHSSFLKFYIHSFSTVTLILFYLGLGIFLQDLKNRRNIQGMIA